MTKPKTTTASAPLTDIIRDQYAAYDKAIQPALAHHKVTCSKGCAHCCHQLTIILPTEAYYLAVHLLRGEGELVHALEALRGAATAYMYDGITEANYFRQAIPCPFLREGLCTVYEARPGVCRYLFSVVDPDMCSPARPAKVKYLDTNEIKDALFWSSMDIAAQGFGDADAAPAPLPLGVLWALAYVIRMSKHEETVIGRAVMDAYAGLPTPRAYMERYLPSIMRAHERPKRLPIIE